MWVSCLEELSTDHTLRIQNIIQLLPRDVSSRQTGSQTATRTPVGSPVGSRDWGHSSVGTVHVQHGQDSELCSLPRATESQAPWNMPQILLLGVEAGDSEVQVILCHMVSLRTAWRSWSYRRSYLKGEKGRERQIHRSNPQDPLNQKSKRLTACLLINLPSMLMHLSFGNCLFQPV